MVVQIASRTASELRNSGEEGPWGRPVSAGVASRYSSADRGTSVDIGDESGLGDTGPDTQEQDRSETTPGN